MRYTIICLLLPLLTAVIPTVDAADHPAPVAALLTDILQEHPNLRSLAAKGDVPPAPAAGNYTIVAANQEHAIIFGFPAAGARQITLRPAGLDPVRLYEFTLLHPARLPGLADAVFSGDDLLQQGLTLTPPADGAPIVLLLRPGIATL